MKRVMTRKLAAKGLEEPLDQHQLQSQPAQLSRAGRGGAGLTRTKPNPGRRPCLAWPVGRLAALAASWPDFASDGSEDSRPRTGLWTPCPGLAIAVGRWGGAVSRVAISWLAAACRCYAVLRCGGGKRGMGLIKRRIAAGSFPPGAGCSRLLWAAPSAPGRAGRTLTKQTLCSQRGMLA